MSQQELLKQVIHAIRARSLRGMLQVTINRVAVICADGAGGDNVDAPGQAIFEQLLDPNHVEEARRSVKLNEDVDVRVRTLLSSGDGAKDADRLHSKIVECRAQAADGGDRLVQDHDHESC